ncbi:MAG: DMT family transporter [Treponema sp.]|nr:DMT family transporter [Treponema sp.]
MKDNSLWTKTPFIILFATISCMLWGSAFPCIKLGYELFDIPNDSSAAQILFGGIRFSISGIMVIIAGSFIQKRVLLPKLKSIPSIILLSLFQTVGQYFFFYIGLARTSGVNASVVEATNTFFTILWACIIFKTEKITFGKIAGCILGFTGVCLIELKGFDLENLHFNFFGDGFILISCLLASFVPSLLKLFSKKEDAFVLSGWQFFIGGLIMIAGALMAGGRMAAPTDSIKAYSLLSYLAFISACAYTLWSLLLKQNDVSRVAIFGFINPVFAFILSAFLLKEIEDAFNLTSMISLVLVCCGIILVYLKKHESVRLL